MARKEKNYKVVVRTDECKGCELCIEFCKSNKLGLPGNINKMGYRYAAPVDGEKCTGCMICTLMCPDLVIEVYDE